MTDSDWERPSSLEMLRRPEVARAWRERLAAWTRDNPQLAADWDAAIDADVERESRLNALAACVSGLEAAGVPERCIDVWRSGLRPTAAFSAVQTFVASGKGFLLLSGGAGTGKTVAACEALTRGGGLFVRAVEACRLSLFDQRDRRRFEAMCRTRALVLDDLGAELLHDGWRPALDELIDSRYGSKLPTILTTNLPPTAPSGVASFRERYGERIADRIRHDGLIELCGNQSLRRSTLEAQVKP